MTLDEKLAALRKQLDEKRAALPALKEEVRSLAEKAESEEDFKAAQDKRSAVEAAEKEINDMEGKRSLYEMALKGEQVPAKVAPATEDRRKEVNDFIRAKDLSKSMTISLREDAVVSETAADNGIKSADNTLTIPIAQTYVPQRELETVSDLKPFTHVIAAKTASGTYPILKNVDGVLHEVAELEKNPALAKPEFSKVDWKVGTYRGSIPISQEDIDDSAADLVGIVAENGRQLKRSTANSVILAAFKTLTAKTVSTVDDLKHIINIDLDPAYNRALIASQTFYNFLDTIKDGNGRYLLHDDITSASGKSILGMPVVVVSDKSFGAGNAFLGDVSRAILFADRADLDIQWADNDVYGKYLRAGMRFGVAVADKNAGFFLTYVDPKA